MQTITLSWFRGLALAGLLLSSVLPGTLHAAACDTPAARLVSLEGSIEIKPAAGDQWYGAHLGAPICPGDFVRTGRYSRGGVLVDGSDTLIRLEQNTTFQLTAPDEKPRSLIDLVTGALHFISRVRHGLEVRTPFMNAAVEGTEFLVRADEKEASVVLYEGVVLASNAAGSLRLAPDQAATAAAGEAPRLSTRISPRDAVQWTLHYQPILHGLLGGKEIAARDPLAPGFQAALDALRRGDSAGAFDGLQAIPPTARDARYHNYRAGLLLLVGRVDEAERELDASQRAEADNGGALALRAMIAVARNQKDEALAFAERAVARDGTSAVPLIALSYARQARFDLPGALASIDQAVASHPDNPYALARQSELRLALGDRRGAMAAAQAAVAIDPEIALTRTVLGFAHLTAVELEPARESFLKAIALDPSDPMPRLGLGLALIRGGELAAGRQELEIATILDPADALVRSYMGKAYYEERRDKLAESQFTLAKSNDPLDPTPWFYEAIMQQQQGLTVEALHSIQNAKARNDNRGVYRSQLQLDQDEAARSAALGQIYRDLNFDQLALVEGWEAVNRDPAEHAGHRLLADTYAHLPRHEVARVSELLQAQLLQPANITPVPPTLGERTLFVPDGAGPSQPAHNEYASLFNRDRVQASVTGLVGNQDQAGGEFLLSGVRENFSFSLGSYHYEEDGWRTNHDLDQDINLAFGQLNLSPDTSVQFEARESRKDYGDRFFSFYRDGNSENLRNKEHWDAMRLGLHHRSQPGADFIANLSFGNREEQASDSPGAARIEGDADADYWVAELRQLWHGVGYRLTGGLSYRENEITRNSDLTLNLPFPLCLFVQCQFIYDNVDVTRHYTAYVYSDIDLTDAFTLDLGLSYDDFQRGDEDIRQFNPKLGLTWRASPATTLRAGVMRSVQREGTVSQTIEPVAVAGFNQFFEGLDRERQWRSALALDHRFDANLSGGLELSRRERNQGGFMVNTETWFNSKRHEDMGRAYLYWAPYRRLALAGEYFYERDHTETTIQTTHRFPFALSYFHPSGVSGSLKPSYVRQYGLFDFVEGNDEETFWNLDLTVDYRLPQRRGQLSFDVRNLLDEEFGYQSNDDNLPLFVGERMAALRLTLNF